VGTGDEDVLTIYGRIPVQSPPAPGNYHQHGHGHHHY
jgi:spore coat protein U-like protein